MPSAFTSPAATWAPASARRREKWRPIPLAAPVTIIFRSASCIVISLAALGPRGRRVLEWTSKCFGEVPRVAVERVLLGRRSQGQLAPVLEPGDGGPVFVGAPQLHRDDRLGSHGLAH